MKLPDLRKTIEQMSDEELLEALRQSRHRRTIERPAVAQRKERAQTKERRSAASILQRKLQKAFAGMSAEDQAKLIKELGGEGG